jgi:signal transduction histidine kinase
LVDDDNMKTRSAPILPPGPRSVVAVWAAAGASVLVAVLSLPSWIRPAAEPWPVRLAGLAALAVGLRMSMGRPRPAAGVWTLTMMVALPVVAWSAPAAAPWSWLGWAAVAVVGAWTLPARGSAAVTGLAASAPFLISGSWDTSVLMVIGSLIAAVGVATRGSGPSHAMGCDRRHLTDEEHGEIEAARALHSVAVTMGSSTTLAEVIPTLLSTIAEPFGAGVAAFLTVDTMARTVKLQSPVLVNGSWVDADDHGVTPIVESGIVEQALRSPRSLIVDLSLVKEARKAALTDLGLGEALLGPLHLDGDSVGLLVLGEPAAGRFGAGAPGHLDLLVGPAALVLAQVGRHERAAALNAELQQLAAMKSDFTSMVIHELRSPLTGVIGALDTMTMPGMDLDEKEVSELVEMARRQSHRLRSLVEDLLTLSRGEAGMAKPVMRHLPLANLATGAIRTLGGHPVTSSIDPHLQVEVDGDRFGQVLVNLLENALKYGGGGPVEVFGSLRGDRVCVRVVDHGPGVPDEHKARVFERFVRLDATRHLGGTGLGLPIVKMFVEGMGGTVAVVDTPGGGATFEVWLPTAAQALGAA